MKPNSSRRRLIWPCALAAIALIANVTWVQATTAVAQSAQGTQTLTGFAYTPSAVTFGDPAPEVTLTPPTVTLMPPNGTQGALSYSTLNTNVCTVDPSTGALTIIGAGSCWVTVTAAATDDYQSATATTRVSVAAEGALLLTVDAVTGDNIINIAEKANGFAITGTTGTEAGASVNVRFPEGESIAVRPATSEDDGTWAARVEANSPLITGSSVTFTVTATKTGFNAAASVIRTLTFDFDRPTAPTYATTPTSLTVGVAIAAISPSGGSAISSYGASGLPAGLTIDTTTGVISGTPTVANANAVTATVTAYDSARNPATVAVAFPAVAKGTQDLSDFAYNPNTAAVGGDVPTLVPPSGARGTLTYSASPARVCSVNSTTGALTISGVGTCRVTVAAAATPDYNANSAQTSVTVSKGTQPLTGFAYNPPSIIFGEDGPTLTAPTGNLGTLTYSASPAGVCSVNTMTGALSIVGGGTCTVTATAAATANYNETPVTATVTVNKASQTLTGFAYTPATATVGGASPTLTAPTGNQGDLSYDAAPDTVCAADSGSGELTFAGVGTCTITVTAASNDSYEPATATTTVEVAKGTYTLEGFAYSSATATVGGAVPTVTAPTNARGDVTYSTSRTDVCAVDPDTGALTIVGGGTCTVTATAAGDDDYGPASATASISVSAAAGTLALTVDAVTGDNIINIAEKAAGFDISGETGTEDGVAVQVNFSVDGRVVARVATSETGGAWSTSVEENASFITGTSVTFTVTATKTGLTAATPASRTLTVDLVAPTASAWTLPTALRVGETLTLAATGGSGIDTYEVTGLPDGLTIDAATGTISGTLTTFQSTGNNSTATVKMSDNAGNSVKEELEFPRVRRGEQPLTGFAYNPPSIIFGDAAPALIAPQGALGALSYSTTTTSVCAVDSTTGALTITSAGTCTVTARAARSADDSWRVTEVTTDVDVGPAVQTLTGFAYDPASLDFGDAAPTLTAPTGNVGALSYSATPATVCMVDSSSGALTITGVGTCTVTATAAATDRYEAVTVEKSVEIAKGTQSLAGFAYSPARIDFGDAAPTLQAPPGARTTLTYASSTTAVCTVDSVGALAIRRDGTCSVTVTAAGTANWHQATATTSVTVDSAGPVPLNVDAVTGDNIINIAEKAAGFDITGATGAVDAVSVTVTFGVGGDATVLTHTSSSDGTWSVSVPAGAAYITGTQVSFSVTATKVGYDDAGEMTVDLAVDLDAPTAPSYATPVVLTVGAAIASISPTGGSGIDRYAAAGLPAGLEINEATGAISGTPTTASTTRAPVTVTASDTAGNSDSVSVEFPVVDKAAQALAWSGYSPTSVTFLGVAPTAAAPSGAVGTVRYSTNTSSVCTVDSRTGVLSIQGAGDCAVTVTASGGGDYNVATVTVWVKVNKADQTLSGFSYTPATLSFGDAAPRVSGPTGQRTTLVYSASPARVCTVDKETGALTVEAAGSCTVTATAEDSADFNVASVRASVMINKGSQTLSGFAYSPASVEVGGAAPTLIEPPGAQTPLTYATSTTDVCLVDSVTGELYALAAGTCTVTVTARGTAEWNGATATAQVTVAAGSKPLTLSVDTVAGDGTVNIAEKADGFAISGKTGRENGVSVTVTFGTGNNAAVLTATSAGLSDWSVSVPAGASYITGTSVAFTVAATKDGFVDAAPVTTALVVDLDAPAAPSYTAPTAIEVATAIEAISPSGGSDIDRYAAVGLPEGLSINAATGVISGTPTAATDSSPIVTVTVWDTAGNSDDTTLAFPLVTRQSQSLTGFSYSPSTVTFGEPTVLTLSAPTGARTSLVYSSRTPDVCTVDATTGALSIVGVGTCSVRVKAVEDANWYPANAVFQVTVHGWSDSPTDPPTVTVRSGNQADVDYSALDFGVDNITGYQIQLAPVGGDAAKYAQQGAVVDVSAGVSQHTISGLDYGASYAVRVRAQSGSSYSDWSLWANLKTPVGPPNQPTGVTVAVNADLVNTLDVAWVAPTWNGGRPVTRYSVSYRKSSDLAGSRWSELAPVAGTSAQITGLEPGTSYDVRVAAINDTRNGQSSYTTAVSATTGTGSPPSRNSVTLAGGAGVHRGAAVLNWTVDDAGDLPITRSRIRWKERGAGNRWLGRINVVGSATTATITGLDPTKVYIAQVRVWNAAGGTNWSRNSTRFRPAASHVVPSEPLSLSVSPGDGSITISGLTQSKEQVIGVWVCVSPVEPLIRRGNCVRDSRSIAIEPAQDGRFTVTVDGLINGTAHHVAVRLVNRAFPGAWSDPVTVTPN